MRNGNAECGVEMQGRSLPEASPDIPHSAFACWRSTARVDDGARRRSTARFRSHRHPRPRRRHRRPAPDRAGAGARTRGAHRLARRPRPGRTRRALARRRLGAAAGRDDVGRARRHRTARRLAPRVSGLPRDRIAAGGDGVRGRRARQRARRARSELRPVAARGRGTGRGGVRTFGAAGPQCARRGGQPRDTARREPGRARNRSVGRKLGTLRAEGARRSAPRRVGLLRRRALRAGARLARGYPQPDRHAVREARAPERDVGRHPQLLGRRQPDLPGGQPPRERGGGDSATQLHRGRLLRSARTPRHPQRPTAAGADAARDQRLRTLALERAVQCELRRGRLAPAERDARRRGSGAALGEAAARRYGAALGRGRGRGPEVCASVSRGFRAPAVVELGCADPQAACPLPFALGPDPALKPVVATTYELGWRVRAPRGGLDASADVYRTDVRDDIFFIASTVTGGYFQNIAATRRSGVELALQWSGSAGARAYANYGYALADLSLTLTWRDLELRGAVGNLFDRRYVSFGTFAENPTAPGTPVQRWLTPGPPRHVQVSLSTDF